MFFFIASKWRLGIIMTETEIGILTGFGWILTYKFYR